MNTQNKSAKKSSHEKLVELIICTMFGTLMFCSKQIMAVLPNIHLLGMLIMILTIIFRFKALISIYIFVLLEGLLGGFSLWWIPYLYVWTVLWGATMLLPRKIPSKAKMVIYPIICALHGLAFGILYAPVQALLFGLSSEGTIAWIITGLPYDIIHGVSNFFVGFLIYPLSELLKKLIYNNKISQKP